MADNIYTERVYIDPERLIKLKKQKRSLKYVPSIFQPPLQTSEGITDDKSINQPSLSLQSKSKPVQQTLQQQILKKSKNANIDFIVTLLGEVKQQLILQLEEGDCLNHKIEERWLILEGQIKITGTNDHHYVMNQGYFFFVNFQTKKKVKEVLCLKPTKILKISNFVFENYLRNYIFLKNAQKIKYLKYCPFFIWSQLLSEDLASCMQMLVYQRQQAIYRPQSAANHIFFVKQGIVLLERTEPLINKVIKQYESHYQKNQISENQTTVIVKKGMVFGIDGILLKELVKNEQIKNEQNYNHEVTSIAGLNPQNFHNWEHRPKINARVYTAKTIGKTEIYSIKKQILQTLFNLSDMIDIKNFSRQMSKIQLQKICSDYADMVVRHRSLPKITQAVIRKVMVLDNQPSSYELQQKKTNVRRIRFHQQEVKRLSIASIIHDPKLIKYHQNQRRNTEDINSTIAHQLNQKLSLASENPLDNNIFAFPLLQKSLKKQRKNYNSINSENHIFRLLKNSQTVPIIEQRKPKSRPKEQKRVKLSLINVKAYRSIIPPLG